MLRLAGDPSSPVFRRGLIRSLAIGLAISLAVLFLSRTHLLRTFELRTLDGRFLLRGERPALSPVSVVFIGDDSIDALGRWPWSWDYHALLIDILTRAGAKAILFDILFTESPGADADALLALAAKSSGRAYFCSFFEPDPNAREEPSGTRLTRAKGLHLPLESIRAAAAGVGHCVAWPDIDGSTRRYPLAVRHGSSIHPSLPLLAAAASLGIPPDRFDLSRPDSIVLPVPGKPVVIPVDAEGLTQIDFTGGIETFPSYSFTQVLQADQFPDRAPFDLSVFRDRIVLVGATFTGNTDMRPTPFSSAFPMMLIQATAMEDILSGRFLHHPPTSLFVAVWLLSGTLLGGLVFIFRPLISAAVGLAAGCGVPRRDHPPLQPLPAARRDGRAVADRGPGADRRGHHAPLHRGAAGPGDPGDLLGLCQRCGGRPDHSQPRTGAPWRRAPGDHHPLLRHPRFHHLRRAELARGGGRGPEPSTSGR